MAVDLWCLESSSSSRSESNYFGACPLSISLGIRPDCSGSCRGGRGETCPVPVEQDYIIDGECSKVPGPAVLTHELHLDAACREQLDDGSYLARTNIRISRAVEHGHPIQELQLSCPSRNRLVSSTARAIASSASKPELARALATISSTVSRGRIPLRSRPSSAIERTERHRRSATSSSTRRAWSVGLMVEGAIRDPV